MIEVERERPMGRNGIVSATVVTTIRHSNRATSTSRPTRSRNTFDSDSLQTQQQREGKFPPALNSQQISWKPVDTRQPGTTQRKVPRTCTSAPLPVNGSSISKSSRLRMAVLVAGGGGAKGGHIQRETLPASSVQSE